ncbi:phage protein [Streptococcus dysgalactiae subsp. equisimilis]|nr:phage protein [Streptococcus dysgalactiae subsp. equisimilis]
MDHSSKTIAGNENIDIIQFDRTHPSDFMTEFLTELPELIKEYDNLVIDNITSWQSDWFIEQGRKSKTGSPTNCNNTTCGPITIYEYDYHL